MGRHWETVDRSISKIVQTEGRTELDCPRFGSKVTISFDTPPDFSNLPSPIRGVHLAKSPSSFILGRGDNEVDRNVEDAVKSMYPGEKSDFSFRVKIVNKDENGKDNVIWGQIEATLSLDVVEEAAPLNKWSIDEKLAFGKYLLSFGSVLFMKSHTVDAFYHYRKAAALLGQEQRHPECMKVYWISVNNIVACHFRWRNFNRVVELASVALEEYDPNNVKLLYRRGVAFVEKNDFKEAKSDLKKVLEIEPRNKAALEKLQALRSKVKNYNAKMGRLLMKGLMSSS